MELIRRLQEVDPEKLTELCRMHLSFALDLPDDEFATLLSSKSESKTRWSYFTRKHKDKSSTDSALTHESISQIYQIIEFLGRDINIDHEGLFRKSGSLSRQQELKALLSAGANIDFSLGHYSIDDCASVMKNFLSELPEPLLTEAHYFAHCQIADMVKDHMTPAQREHVYQRQMKSVRLLLLLLPQENYCLLKCLLLLLSQVKISHERNKMTSGNLATVFAPQILCPRKMPAEELKNSFPRMVKVVSFLIDNALLLFEPPVELVHDVSLYLKELSRGEIPNGSETTPVKTTIAFCERSNMEGQDTEDYTKKALRELHSYIQNLPNSARKRKLIKKFHHENPGDNEHGNRRKHFRSRSVGEAIKKHLWRSNKDVFQKSRHHSSYDTLSSGSGLEYGGQTSKAKSVEALNLERLNCSSKSGSQAHGSNWMRASKKLRGLKF